MLQPSYLGLSHSLTGFARKKRQQDILDFVLPGAKG